MNDTDIEVLAEAAWMDAVFTYWARCNGMGPNWYNLSNGDKRKNLDIARVVIYGLPFGTLVAVHGESPTHEIYVQRLVELAHEPDRAKVVADARRTWRPEEMNLPQLRVAFNMLLHYVDLRDMKDIGREPIFDALLDRLMKFQNRGAYPVCSPRPKTFDDLLFPYSVIVKNMLKGRKVDFPGVSAKMADAELEEILCRLGMADASWQRVGHSPADRKRLLGYITAVKANSTDFPVHNVSLASKFIETAIDVIHGENLAKLARVAYVQCISRALGEWDLLRAGTHQWYQLTKETVFGPVRLFNRVNHQSAHSIFVACVAQKANLFFSDEVVKNMNDWRNAPAKRREVMLNITSNEVNRMKREEREEMLKAVAEISAVTDGRRIATDGLRNADRPMLRDAVARIKTQSAPGVNDKIMERVEAAEQRETAPKVDQRENEVQGTGRSEPPSPLRGHRAHSVVLDEVQDFIATPDKVGTAYAAYHPDDIHYFPGAPDDIGDVLPTPLGQFTIGGNTFTITSAMIEGNPLPLRLFPNANNNLHQAFHTKRDFGILFRPPHGLGTRRGLRLYGLTAKSESYTCQPDGNTIRETLSCTFERIELWSPTEGGLSECASS